MDALSASKVVPGHVRVTLVDLLDTRIAELRRDIQSMKLYNRPELVRMP